MSLAIESGASHTVAVYAQSSDYNNLKRFHFGAANYKLLKEIQLEAFFNEIKSKTAKYDIKRLAVGMPGIIAERDKKAVNKVVNRVWHNLENVWIGSDTETALACVDDDKYVIKCIVISGTGSCCYGYNGQINMKIGGYGHILGDRGSGYSISHLALREALRDFEYAHNTAESHEDHSVLLNAILKNLNLSSIYELVSWSLVASKAEFADLAQLILKMWQNGNHIAVKVVESAINDLASDIKCLVDKLRDKQNITDSQVRIGFVGSLLSKNAHFSNALKNKLKELSLNANVINLKETVLGALRMITNNDFINSSHENGVATNQMTNAQLAELILPISTSLSTTELRNPQSMHLDTMSVKDAINLMINEESTIHAEIRKSIPSIEKLINRITYAFQNGGRLLYCGAGTSGRLGILDASECPPTFKAPPHWVQGIIAGGTKAIQSPVEGAEDSIIDGMEAIERKDVNENDVVIGIAACGRTPFVWGSVYAALQRKAFTAFISFNTNIKPKLSLDVMVTVNTGPEVLTGSTRLKCGSATKCILNVLTTLSMVQYGKCLENLMVDLMPANEKLRDRALRITLIIVNHEEERVSREHAKMILEKNNYDIKKTVAKLREEL